jgi:SAM-dependent methyltransferase
MDKQQKIDFFDAAAKDRLHWKKKNGYYYKKITQFMRFVVPEGSVVLEIGCGTGDLLNDLKPGKGVGIDFSANMIEIAKNNYPELTFIEMDANELNLDYKFDYVILSDFIGYLDDVQAVFEKLHTVCHSKTKVVVTYYNFLWESTLKFGEKLKFKMKEYHQNWLSKYDILNLLDLANFETIRSGAILLLPVYIPVLSEFINRYVSKFFHLSTFCFINYSITRPVRKDFIVNNDYSCSVIVPARNEYESIEKAVLEIPDMGRSTEIIFVE